MDTIDTSKGPHHVAGIVSLTILWFVVTALIDACITVWIFRRYGGCPIHDRSQTPLDVKAKVIR
jgi:hypothetical protein